MGPRVVVLLVLTFASACGGLLVVDEDAGAGGAMPATGAAPDAPNEAEPDAGPCVAAADPLACGCCFSAPGVVACPPGTVPPDAAVITLPCCP